jgi:hypothetical protein
VIGLLICAATGNIYMGLLYPIFLALLTIAIGTKLLPESHYVRIWNELEAKRHGDERPPDAVGLEPAPSAGR